MMANGRHGRGCTNRCHAIIASEHVERRRSNGDGDRDLGADGTGQHE